MGPGILGSVYTDNTPDVQNNLDTLASFSQCTMLAFDTYKVSDNVTICYDVWRMYVQIAVLVTS